MQLSKSAKLFVIVEGSENDSWYYDALCDFAALDPGDWMVWTAEQFSRDGKDQGRAGGRDSVFALHDEAVVGDFLRVRSRRHEVTALFCVDADLDRFLGGMRRSRHLYYTSLPDSEAEILNSCDLISALGAVASVTKSTAAEAFVGVGGDIDSLAHRLVPIVSLYLTARHAQSEKVSPLPNGPDFTSGQPPSCSAANLRRHRARAVSSGRLDSQAFKNKEVATTRTLHHQIQARGGMHLLKGKWAAMFLKNVIDSYLRANGRRPTSGNNVMAVSRGCVRLRRKHARRFIDKVSGLLG